MDATHFWQYVNEGLMTAALAVGSYGIAWLKHFLETRAKFLSVQTDQMLSDRADQIMRSGLALAMTKLGTIEPKTIEGRSLLVNVAGQYFLDHAPEIIDHFGFSPDQITNMLIARLPMIVTGVDTTGVTLKPAVVEVRELPPVPK